MNKLINVLLMLTLAEFLGATAYVLFTYGLFGWIEPLLAEPVGWLVTFDAAIAISIGAWWVYTDARERGTNPWPYLALTACTGAAGPLLYLIRRRLSR